MPDAMQKYVFFWLIVGQFVVSFVVTILGVIGKVTIPDGILRALVGVLILEQAGAVLAIFKATDFFESNSSVSNEGWDLLATLWKYQIGSFGNDKSRRWFLALKPDNPDFREFAIGFSRLHDLGLVAVGTAQFEISLTDKGYQYCQQNDRKLKKRKRLFYIA
jgi:hypothetical protein